MPISQPTVPLMIQYVHTIIRAHPSLSDDFWKRLIKPVTPTRNRCTFTSVAKLGFEHGSDGCQQLDVNAEPFTPTRLVISPDLSDIMDNGSIIY